MKIKVFSSICMVLLLITSIQSQSLKPLEYNRDELVIMAAEGVIAPPILGDPPFRVSPDGEVGLYPGTGSITYNFRAGDSAYKIAADHVEPAVSIYNLGSTNSRNSRENIALNSLSCIGNEALVISGEAKGSKGRVIGKHGGAEHIMVDFADEVYDKLGIGDKIRIRTHGAGMKLSNLDGVAVRNMSPYLLEALTKAGLGVANNGKLRAPVTHFVPAKIMGSGLGRNHVYKGDYDIQLFDEKVIKEHNLASLRFGDIVAIMDADNTYGRIYKTGAISIGVVAHSRSFTAGHGPGVVTLFSSASGKIEPFIAPDTNVEKLLNIR